MPLPAAPAVRTRETHPLSRFLLAGFYALAGLGHFVFADALVTIVPAAVPFARAIVLLTGLFELLAAVLLLVPSKKLRALAAIGLALYAVAVYPANIQHMLNDLASPTGGLGLWYHLPRLALQPLLVLWPLQACGLLRRFRR
ncbi:hypothetical protein [Rhizobium sp. CC-YZS058]|uniref:DoxX family protein n=1 Tax=Rhizobium sp. CC-YZS058 TaxID=3042153 RepID=UPI002B05C522|nr:hypothetical protein [Rhizobium sp. CC-YZS058]MEA3535491.1 hypothetical protein [Rhizobium sp. CC-YZS058]